MRFVGYLIILVVVLPPLVCTTHAAATIDLTVCAKFFEEATRGFARDWFTGGIHQPFEVGKSVREVSTPDWKTCSPASLRGHIVNAHFQARTLRYFGIARWDIEIAQYRQIPLDWVASRAYEKLERHDEDIQGEIDLHSQDPGVTDSFTIAEYKTVLVKNLRFIERMRLAKIDWERVERAFPGAALITVDPDKDSTDESFLEKRRYY